MMKKKILMVDDEKDFCHFVKLNLKKSGRYQVPTAFKDASLSISQSGFTKIRKVHLM